MPDKDKEAKNIIVELSPAISYLVRSLFAESREREEKDTRYMKEAESYVEVLLDLAITVRKNRWTNGDKREVGQVLRGALDKVLNKKPLSESETKLVKAFQDAAQPVVPVAS